jgi:hypothetical protein
VPAHHTDGVTLVARVAIVPRCPTYQIDKSFSPP